MFSLLWNEVSSEEGNDFHLIYYQLIIDFIDELIIGKIIQARIYLKI